MVITLLAIMALVVLPTTINYLGGVKQDNAALKIVSDIRYAQNRATTTRQRSWVSFAGAANYDIYSCATAAQCPCAAWNLISQVNLNNDYPGVTILSTVANLEFDSLGRPHNGADCVNSAGATVTVIHTGEAPKTVTVLAETGMVSY